MMRPEESGRALGGDEFEAKLMQPLRKIGEAVLIRDAQQRPTGLTHSYYHAEMDDTGLRFRSHPSPMDHERRMALAREVTDYLLKHHRDIVAVILEGSTAKGEDREHSDLEISVITKSRS